MRRTLALASAFVLVAVGGSAFAVSDGHYAPARQHCSGSADNKGAGVQPGCYNSILALLDGTGHEYVGAGGRQTVKAFVNTFDVWVDPGQGTKYTWTIQTGTPPAITGPTASPGTPADPSTGMQLYFGADDNLDGGEHDSSSQINNGPSDGGGISVHIDPDAARAWADALAAMDVATLLSNPLPLADAGTGACADGLCFGATAIRRVAYQGGDLTKHRDAPNYEGKRWDPQSCSGDSDGATPCQNPAGISYWHNLEGTVYVEPGLNIFEDPDPQGSPIGPYPIPALYVGPCGFVFGGGADGTPLRFDGQPGANAAGQIVVKTLCS